MQNNIFLPGQIEYVSNSVLWKTIREYQRSYTTLARRRSVSSQGILVAMREAIEAIEAELHARGFETNPVCVAVMG